MEPCIAGGVPGSALGDQAGPHRGAGCVLRAGATSQTPGDRARLEHPHHGWGALKAPGAGGVSPPGEGQEHPGSMGWPCRSATGFHPIPRAGTRCSRPTTKEDLVQVRWRGKWLDGAGRCHAAPTSQRPVPPAARRQDPSRCLPAQSMLVLADLEMFRVWAEMEMSSWSTGLW